jgi:LmbE family N-acetylglucosaminyl deacetylase
MNFSRPEADVFVPDGTAADRALARTTELCIAAHQDDIEIMAYPGIAACHGRDDRWFTGVVVTDGGGSPRAGKFASFTDEQMKAARREEQRAAARIGRYSAVVQLAHPSAAVKDASLGAVRDDIARLLAAMSPQVVYLHNPADKHDTHVAVLHRCIEALRGLPAGKRPQRVIGCEVWRNLDWLVDADKVVLDASANPQLAAELVAVFETQVAGGKRYDLATAGRRLANATFHTAHATDKATALIWGMDLTPVVNYPKLSLEAFTLAYIDRLRDDVASRLRRFQ